MRLSVMLVWTGSSSRSNPNCGHFQRVRAQKVTRKNVFAGAGSHFQRVRAQKVT